MYTKVWRGANTLLSIKVWQGTNTLLYFTNQMKKEFGDVESFGRAASRVYMRAIDWYPRLSPDLSKFPGDYKRSFNIFSIINKWRMARGGTWSHDTILSRISNTIGLLSKNKKHAEWTRKRGMEGWLALYNYTNPKSMFGIVANERKLNS